MIFISVGARTSALGIHFILVKHIDIFPCAVVFLPRINGGFVFLSCGKNRHFITSPKWSHSQELKRKGPVIP